MVRKIGLGCLWLTFVVYAFCFSPPDDSNTLTLIQNLSTGQWQGINPLIIALFNLMGIWPMMYGILLCVDGDKQPLPVWPFVVGCFFLGAFALVPYLALRNPAPSWSGQASKVLSLCESRWTGILISIVAIATLGYGLSQGDWADFIHQWQTNRFIHVMTLDFCLLSGLFPTLLGDDMARRQWFQPTRYWILACLPFLGALAYLCVRPSLPQEPQPVAQPILE